MINDDVANVITDRLASRINTTNEYILRKIGESIKSIGALTPSEAQQLVQMLKYGGEYNEIVKELAKLSNTNVKDIEMLIDGIAKANYQLSADLYKYRNMSQLPYEQNTVLVNSIEALKRATTETYKNISNTTSLGYGILDTEGNVVYKGLQDAYHSLLDEAVMSISQGKETFQEAMRRQIECLSESGLRVIYPSGYTRRLDSSVKMNISDALNELHNREQEILGEQFEANGIEVTAHIYPAPDHELMQGRQFSLEEYIKLNNQQEAKTYDGLIIPANEHRRRVSTLNCKHYERRIILGVSKRLYTDEQLSQILIDNNEGVDFEGKHYTLYELTQLQRQVEVKIRQLLDKKVLAESSGDEVALSEANAKLTEVRRRHRQIRKLLKENTEVII